MPDEDDLGSSFIVDDSLNISKSKEVDTAVKSKQKNSSAKPVPRKDRTSIHTKQSSLVATGSQRPRNNRPYQDHHDERRGGNSNWNQRRQQGPGDHSRQNFRGNPHNGPNAPNYRQPFPPSHPPYQNHHHHDNHPPWNNRMPHSPHFAPNFMPFGPPHHHPNNYNHNMPPFHQENVGGPYNVPYSGQNYMHHPTSQTVGNVRFNDYNNFQHGYYCHNESNDLARSGFRDSNTNYSFRNNRNKNQQLSSNKTKAKETESKPDKSKNKATKSVDNSNADIKSSVQNAPTSSKQSKICLAKEKKSNEETIKHSDEKRPDMVNVLATSEGVISIISTTDSVAHPLVAAKQNLNNESRKPPVLKLLKIRKSNGELRHYQWIEDVVVLDGLEFAKFDDLLIELTEGNTISDSMNNRHCFIERGWQ